VQSDDDAVRKDLVVLDTIPMEEAFGCIAEDAVATYDVFLRTTRPLLAETESALAAANLGVAAEKAHSAKGAANMTGAYRLGALFADIETGLKSGDLATVRRKLDAVPAVFAEVEDAINAIRAGL
jgi:HPt (histidine-containing phosphotransfer) domain-containing protein